MASSIFFKANKVSQVTASGEISWQLDSSPVNVDTNSGLLEPLSSFENKSTGTLFYSYFNFLNIPATSDGSTTTVIDGLECKIISNKDARIVDSVIQLSQSNSVIGTNQALSTAGEIHTYGSSTNKWGTSLSYGDLATLQVAIKYKSGSIPHKDTCFVNSVQLKIYYT